MGIYGTDVCVLPCLRSGLAPRSIGEDDQAVAAQPYVAVRHRIRSYPEETEDSSDQEYEGKHGSSASTVRLTLSQHRREVVAHDRARRHAPRHCLESGAREGRGIASA